MLYVPFLAEKMVKKNLQQGDHKCASGGGGGQRSMVKDHKMTFFWDPFPNFFSRFKLFKDNSKVNINLKIPETRNKG